MNPNQNAYIQDILDTSKKVYGVKKDKHGVGILGTYKGFTVDFRLQEFQRVRKNGHIDFLDFRTHWDFVKDMYWSARKELGLDEEDELKSPEDCDHEEFNDFSGDCVGCGMTPQDFLDKHEKKCVVTGDFEISEDDGTGCSSCSKCGMNIPLLQAFVEGENEI